MTSREQMGGDRRRRISKADTAEAMGEFWDTHDFTDFDTDAPDVQFEVALSVPIEVGLFGEIEREAHRRGVTIETLVNLWLHQKLAECGRDPRRSAMQKRRGLIGLALVAALAVGYAVGRATPRADASLAETSVFVDAVGRAGMSALTLQLLRDEDAGKLDRLHRQVLRANLAWADRASTADLAADTPLPELVAAAARTAELCATDSELADLADTAARIHERMRTLSAGAL